MTVAELCAIAQVGEEAQALVREGLGPREYLDLLVEKQHFTDAVRLLAHALPKREAVWWAWVCARRASGANPPPKIQAALAATEKWISQPTEENRRAAMRMAEQAEFRTAAGCAGLAAFCSGGSLAPAEAPPVPPGEYLTAQAVSGAVIASAVSSEPEKAGDKLRAFIEQGLDVVNRVKVW